MFKKVGILILSLVMTSTAFAADDAAQAEEAQVQVVRRAFDIDASQWDEVDLMRAGQMGVFILYGAMAKLQCGGNSTLDKIARPLLALESTIGVSRVQLNPADDLRALIGAAEVMAGIGLLYESRKVNRNEGELLAGVCDKIAGAGLIAYGVGHGVKSDTVKSIIGSVMNWTDETHQEVMGMLSRQEAAE